MVRIRAHRLLHGAARRGQTKIRKGLASYCIQTSIDPRLCHCTVTGVTVSGENCTCRPGCLLATEWDADGGQGRSRLPPPLALRTIPGPLKGGRNMISFACETKILLGRAGNTTVPRRQRWSDGGVTGGEHGRGRGICRRGCSQRGRRRRLLQYREYRRYVLGHLVLQLVKLPTNWRDSLFIL